MGAYPFTYWNSSFLYNKSLFFIHSYFQWGTLSFCLVSLRKASQTYLPSSITLPWTLGELIHNFKIHFNIGIDWLVTHSFIHWLLHSLHKDGTWWWWQENCVAVIKVASSVWIDHSSYQQSGKIIHLCLLHREDISAVCLYVCSSERSDSKAWCVTEKFSSLPVDKVRRAVYLTFPLCSIYNICRQTTDKWREQSGPSAFTFLILLIMGIRWSTARISSL